MKDFKQRGSFGDRKTGGFGERRSSGGFERRDSRDSRGGGGRDFNRGGGFGDKRSAGFGPAKFRATCAECGTNCEVPFKPSGERPVYCSDCFKNKENVRPGQNDRQARPSFDRNAAKPYSASVNQPANDYHDKINQKLDKILSILESLMIEVEEGEDEEYDEEPDTFRAEVKEEKMLVPVGVKKAAKQAASKKAPAKKGKKK